MSKELLSKWYLHFSGRSYPVRVPGDFLHDLAENHLIPNPDFADNLLQAQPYLHQEAVYETSFSLSELSPHIVLNFEGIDTYSEITFNGVLLGKTRNMFIPYAYDVTSLARLGENTLEVKLLPVYRFLDDQDHGWSLFNKERMQLRKAACHFGWDWSPNLPGYGIYLPVSLLCYETRIEDFDVQTTIDGAVKIHLQVNEACSASLSLGEKSLAHFELQTGKNCFSFQVKNPDLWYPNGYGRSTLYRAKIDLERNGMILEQKAFHFAFRKIEVYQEPLAGGRSSFGFKVNGKKIFSRGSNWVPCSNQTGAIQEETYRKLLQAAKDAHFNLIRVWGGGFYEKEIFYDLCDQLGLLVWQDFMFACQKTPIYPEFWSDVKAEALYQSQRIHQHPCLALFSGGNELYYKKEEVDNPLNSLLKEVVEQKASDVFYIPSSPFGDNEDQWDLLSGDSHASCFEKALLNKDVPHYGKYIDENQAQFYSESGILGSCRLASLKRFMPHDKLWPLNSLYDLHFFKNPYALDPKETFAIKEKRLGEALYGPIDNVEDFCKKSALAQASILYDEIAYARTNPDCAGFMNWMYNDNWGCGTWSLIDFCGEKKPAYYAAKRAFKPLICPWVYRGGAWHLYVVNATAKEHHLSLEYGSVNEKGEQESKKKSIFIRGDEILNIFPSARSIDDAKVLYASLKEKGRLVDENFHWFILGTTSGIVPSLSCQLRLKKRSGAILHFHASSFVRGIHLSAPVPLSCSDNDFDLRKGETREVFVKGLSRKEWGRLQIRSLDDVWED